jgi:hypothetical protein
MLISLGLRLEATDRQGLSESSQCSVVSQVHARLFAMRNEQRKVEEQLLKMAEKSRVTEHKKSVKQSILKETGSEVSPG